MNEHTLALEWNVTGTQLLERDLLVCKHSSLLLQPEQSTNVLRIWITEEEAGIRCGGVNSDLRSSLLELSSGVVIPVDGIIAKPAIQGPRIDKLKTKLQKDILEIWLLVAER